MEFSSELISAINVALNESDWLDVRLDAPRARAEFMMRVMTLPELGPEPADRRLVLRCSGVGRVAASLRAGRWNDEAAAVEPVTVESLPEIVRSFEGQPVYGWDFIDPKDEKGNSWTRWRQCLSLDAHFGGQGDHVIELFQESLTGPVRHLDVRVWFEDLSTLSAEGHEVPIEDVTSGGKRWWDGFFAGDPRTQGHGMGPLKPDASE